MIYLSIGQRVAISGKLHDVAIIKTYGGLLSGCAKHTLVPMDGGQRLIVMQWADGERGIVRPEKNKNNIMEII